MKRERFEEIFSEDSTNWNGDNAFQGLCIIAKYINPNEKTIIQGAGHDEIWSVGIDEIIEAGITERDAISLRNLNWMIQDDYLACFV